MIRPFELLLFVSSPDLATAAEASGIDAVVVDWECRGKDSRQAGKDTQINRQTARDLHDVRKATRLPVICRINASGPWTYEEVSSAVDEGADEILLPMVRAPREVSEVIDMAAGRCGIGMLIETIDAVRDVREYASLPLSRVYVGLNDLSIERGATSIFDAVADGTLDALRDHVTAPFGFGGLTLPHRGAPIPCALLIAEMARLRSDFAFLRRSFLRDVARHEFPRAIKEIRGALRLAAERTSPEAMAGRLAISRAIMTWR